MGHAKVGRRGILAALAVGAFTLGTSGAFAASGSVPVRVRVIKGSRQGPAEVDPRLHDVKAQLSRLAYQRWEQAAEQEQQVDFNKPVSVAIPGGGPALELTLLDARKDTVTFQLKVGGKTQSKLTISKDQRIVHQVTDEKDGAAYFATIRPWP
jgi:hypothetical protein